MIPIELKASFKTIKIERNSRDLSWIPEANITYIQEVQTQWKEKLHQNGDQYDTKWALFTQHSIYRCISYFRHMSLCFNLHLNQVQTGWNQPPKKSFLPIQRNYSGVLGHNEIVGKKGRSMAGTSKPWGTAFSSGGYLIRGVIRFVPGIRRPPRVNILFAGRTWFHPFEFHFERPPSVVRRISAAGITKSRVPTTRELFHQSILDWRYLSLGVGQRWLHRFIGNMSLGEEQMGSPYHRKVRVTTKQL